MNRLLILNYHDVRPKEAGKKYDKFTVEINQFLNHIELIESTKIPIINLSDWREMNKSEDLMIALTFDDGYASHFNFVLPLLQDRAIKASFFPTVSKIEQEGFMNWDNLREILDKNHEIGSHGNTHKRLTWVSERTLHAEILTCRNHLRQKLNIPVDYFSLPNGTYTKKTLLYLANSDYKRVLTTSSKINSNKSAFLLHRFNVKNTWDCDHLLELLNCVPSTIMKKRITSRAGLAYNRISSIFNYYQKE